MGNEQTDAPENEHVEAALAAIQRQDWAAAIEHGEKAIAAPDAPVEAHANLGWALDQAGRAEDARAAFQRAYATDPTRSEPIYHLLRLGVMPRGEGEEEGEPSALETLQRLELYSDLAQWLPDDPNEGQSLVGTWTWAMERGAPWARTVTWLMQQGARNDAEVLSVLPQRDEHLAHSVISGMILAPAALLRKAIEARDDVAILADDERVPDGGGGAPEPGRASLYVQFGESEDRAQIPPQRTHAGVLYGILLSLIPELGADGSVALVLDPAEFLGPRRAWLIGAISEAEVIGSWQLDPEDDEDESRALANDPRLMPPPDAMPSNESSVELPGIDADSLTSVLADSELSDAAWAREGGGAVVFDADAVGRSAEAWMTFLGRVARWLPAGSAALARWRRDGTERLSLLRRNNPLTTWTLRPCWPPEQDSLELPATTELQLLGRALFQAPRSGRFMGRRS